MAQNKETSNPKAIFTSEEEVRIMGSDNTMKGLKLRGVKAVNWEECDWTCSELDGFENMNTTDCFCLAVKKAGEMGAWIMAESFKDLWEELPDIFRKYERKPTDTELKIYRSHITIFDFNEKVGLNPSEILTKRIADTYARNKNGINRKNLTEARKINLSDGKSVDHLFVKGDSGIEKKRKKENAQRALKPKFLSSISGNIDIELLNYANNRVNERINKDEKQKNYLDLSFISIGTNWETRDGVSGGGENDLAMKERQLPFMKAIIDAIVNRHNILIDYRPHGYDSMECVVSPHRLRKDRQWIIFGYSIATVNGTKQSSVFSFKLDRIYGVKQTDGEYIGDDVKEISEIYKRISRNQITYDVLPGRPSLQSVVIAVKGKFNDNAFHGRTFAYNKIKEEKIHGTQREIDREEMVVMGHGGSIEGLDNWGFFEFEVYDSARIAYRLLQHGADLKVITPRTLQEKMRKISEELYRLYH